MKNKKYIRTAPSAEHQTSTRPFTPIECFAINSTAIDESIRGRIIARYTMIRRAAVLIIPRKHFASVVSKFEMSFCGHRIVLYTDIVASSVR